MKKANKFLKSAVLLSLPLLVSLNWVTVQFFETTDCFFFCTRLWVSREVMCFIGGLNLE